MIEYMWCGYKKIVQPVTVYSGSSLTITLAWFDPGTMSLFKDIVAILVGLATLVYTITLIIEKVHKIRRK